jgi:predicted metalloprotease
VPLSEHEQRMLEQMERALYAEDPKFATALEGSELRTYTRRRVYQAVAGFLTGIALLMAGMVAQIIWVSVVGFLVMLGCAVLAVTGWRRSPRQGARTEGEDRTADGGELPDRGQPKQRRSMMNRIEQRWQRRRDEQQ